MRSDRVAVEPCSSPPAGWDDFVAARPDAAPYHRAAAVDIARRAFGFQCHFLVALSPHSEIRGVLPLVEQPRLLSGRKLVSVPFFNYGGILADGPGTARALASGAETLAISHRASGIELRHVSCADALDFSVSLEKATLLLSLPAEPQELWRRFGSKLRSQIRRAEREAPVVRVGGAELLDGFYRVFCSVMRDLGTPVYPRRFFEVVLQWAGTDAAIVTIELDGLAVAGALLLQSGSRMEIPWAATIRPVKARAINMRLYWEVLQLAMARGCKVFDFGRSTVNSGPYVFKRQWGAVPLQLHWQCWSRGGDGAHGAGDSRGSSRALAARVWQRLPLSAANSLGPYISSRLPW